MPLFELNDGEEWRDVVGFEGFYQVSNLGRIKSLERVTSDNKHLCERILTPQGSTYLSIDLWREGHGYNKSIHRLVAEAFLPNPDNLPEVNHKDDSPRNNYVTNLEWVTSSDNSRHRVKQGKPSSYGKAVKCLETGHIFDSLSAAGRSVAASTQQVIDSINVQGCCKGYTFVYMNNIPEDEEAYMQQALSKYQSFHKHPNMQNSRSVKAVESGQIFDSIAAAARYYNCDTATITNRIKANKAFNGVTLEFVE